MAEKDRHDNAGQLLVEIIRGSRYSTNKYSTIDMVLTSEFFIAIPDNKAENPVHP